ncbi:MAG TPA: hypothetical protein VHV31_12580 [Nitrolancea sp.]|nr:hypothetical protein [Nitrolancea sp.]
MTTTPTASSSNLQYEGRVVGAGLDGGGKVGCGWLIAPTAAVATGVPAALFVAESAEEAKADAEVAAAGCALLPALVVPACEDAAVAAGARAADAADVSVVAPTD